MTREAAPLVSIVLPVYNGGPFLESSIQCILDQSFTDFEFIIIDDGSTDGSADVVMRFSDPRIRFHRQPNQGLATTLNTAIGKARGKWVARQDQDDLSVPERLAEQVTFLQDNPNIGLLGTWAKVVDSEGRPIGVHEHPTTHDRIRFDLLIDNPFVHASTIFSKDLWSEVGGYDTDKRVFEDYDLWSRMVERTEAANLPKHLVHYREVGTSISRTTTDRNERVIEQRRRNFRTRYPALTVEESRSLAGCTDGSCRMTIAHFRLLCQVLRQETERAEQPIERRHLVSKARRMLLGRRVIAHRSLFHRVLDRTTKEWLLLNSPFHVG